jgi:hypothetical protein
LQILQHLDRIITLKSGSQLILKVLVNFEKHLDAKWFRNGVCIDEYLNQKRFKYHFNNGLYTLTIDNVIADSDYGVYTFGVKDFVNNKVVKSDGYVFITGI